MTEILGLAFHGSGEKRFKNGEWTRRKQEEGGNALEVEYERKMILEFVYILRILILVIF